MIGIDFEIKNKETVRNFIKTEKYAGLVVALSIAAVTFVIKAIKIVLWTLIFLALAIMFNVDYKDGSLAAFLLGVYISSDAINFFYGLKEKFYKELEKC